jgi:hypothetical protein
MWSALSDERTGLSFTSVKISSTCHLYLEFYMSESLTVSGLTMSPVPCGCLLLTALHVTLRVYVQYTQGLWQSRLGTAEYGLTDADHVTTAS